MILGSMIKDWPIENIFSTIKYNSWHIFYDTYEWGTTRVNWLGYNLRMTGPYDLPLWFLRDLIVVIAFTPVIYYMVRKFKFYFANMDIGARFQYYILFLFFRRGVFGT